MIGMLANLQDPARFGAQIMIGPSPCYINQEGYIGGFSRSDIESLLDGLRERQRFRPTVSLNQGGLGATARCVRSSPPPLGRTAHSRSKAYTDGTAIAPASVGGIEQ